MDAAGMSCYDLGERDDGLRDTIMQRRFEHRRVRRPELRLDPSCRATGPARTSVGGRRETTSMHEPRKGALTRRESARGGRRETDASLERDSAGAGRPVIVVAEDDRAALDGLSQWLAGEGFTVLSCATFAEARAQLATRRVAALLTDVRLAEYNGLHLVQLARSQHPRAGLVVFSGHSDDVLQAEARALGAIWLLKPIDLDVVREYLKGILGKQEA
jgi:two-component system, LuxR family, response regulator FixJ